MSARQDEAAVLRSMIENWATGVRAQNIDAVLLHHSPDMLMFDVVGPVRLQGIDNYRATWLDQFFPWHGGTGGFELRDLHVRAGDNVAFATALLDCAGTEDGKRVDFTLRLTIGFEKKNGAWTVVHEHHSEPLPFDNARIGAGSQ